MWKQGNKRQTNSFAPTKQQNTNYRRNTRNQSPDHTHERTHRGPNKRPFTYNRNQTIDSQGPDVKVRGTLSQITEKYIGLARDATISGDRVLAENLLQHAEHYVRILNEIAPPISSHTSTPDMDPAQMPQPPYTSPLPPEQRTSPVGPEAQALPETGA